MTCLPLEKENTGLGFTDPRRTSRNLVHKLDGRLDISIKLVGGIPPSARGKAIYVDQRIAPAKTPNA